MKNSERRHTMSNLYKILALMPIVVILLCFLYQDRKNLEIAEKIHYMDSLDIDRKDKRIKMQDSIIEYLYQLKVTKIAIIEKDTVK